MTECAIYNDAFQIIAYAGDAKSDFMEAINMAKQQQFQEAKKWISEGCSRLNEAHQIQFQLIQKEVQEKNGIINILMTHAQDHLTMAILTHERALDTLEFYGMLFSLENKLKEMTLKLQGGEPQ